MSNASWSDKYDDEMLAQADENIVFEIRSDLIMAESKISHLCDDMERQSEIIAALRNEIATKDKQISILLEENRKLPEKVRK